MIAAIPEFLREFAHQLPIFGLPFLLSWAIVLGVELLIGKRVQGHLRPHILRVDQHLRTWALSKRYKERGNPNSERHLRTWFMRFWTNFASAPSLIVLSLAVAIWAHAAHVVHPTLWYFPGLCYLGSMSQSYVSKRVIKRMRPRREHGAFGFKMKDGSFPSGHSLTSFCFWVALAITMALAGLPTIEVVLMGVMAAITIGFTGFSRVYMGVHFPTDILGGFLMGIIWTLVCVVVLVPALVRGF
ncbi:phosphatase PAP2 family protein [bacterium]|nr:MAG: phosphatase PAP2 family protein [bacterium]